MKKVLSILISGFLLASGMQVSLDRHYCGGSLADVKISLTGRLASCGMEKPESDCPIIPTIDSNCCEDQISLYSLSSNYLPEYFEKSDPNTVRAVIPFYVDSYLINNTYSPELNRWILPPGDNLKSVLTLPEICVFRI